MNLKQLKKWKKVRVKGKFRFVLLHGVLKCGVPAAILYRLYKISNLSNSSLDGEIPNSADFSSFCIDLISFSIVGFIVGLWTWVQNEKEYLLRKYEIIKSDKESVKFDIT